MRLYLTTLLGLLSVFLIAACRPDAPEAQDPCAKAKPFVVNFKIAEVAGDTLVETDSVLIDNTVTFVGDEGYDSYAWQIGGDTTSFRTCTVRLRFEAEGGVWPGDRITVRLTAQKRRSECFPNDPTEASLTKSFRIIHWRDAPIIGRYEGYFGSDRNRADRQVVEVKHIDEGQWGGSGNGWGGMYILNINKGCNAEQLPYKGVWSTPYTFGIAGRTSRYASFASGGSTINGCLGPFGDASLRGRDTLQVRFSHFVGQNNFNRITDTFVGVRKRN